MDHEMPTPFDAPKRSKSPGIIAVVAVVVAAGSCVFAGVAFSEARQSQKEFRESRGSQQDLADRLETLEAEINGIGSDLVDTQSAVDNTHSSMEDLRNEVGNISDPSGGLTDLSSRLDSVESELTTATSSIDDLSSGLDIVAEHFTSCINAYMKTVGDAGGGRYTYRFC